jgi:hypothetical protein
LVTYLLSHSGPVVLIGWFHPRLCRPHFDAFSAQPIWLHLQEEVGQERKLIRFRRRRSQTYQPNMGQSREKEKAGFILIFIHIHSGKKKYVNPLELPGFLHKLVI